MITKILVEILFKSNSEILGLFFEVCANWNFPQLIALDPIVYSAYSSQNWNPIGNPADKSDVFPAISPAKPLCNVLKM